MSGNRQSQPEYLLNEEDSNMFEELNLSKKEVLNAALISSKAYSDNDDSVSLYINGDGVHFEKKQYFDVDGTEGVIYYDVTDHILYVAFRGTSGIKDVSTDINILGKKFLGTKAHRGFVEAFEDVQYILEDVIKTLLTSKFSIKKIIVSGHSLGGALAQLGYLYMHMNYKTKLDELGVSHALVTFGSPKVFHARAIDTTMIHIFGKTLRVTHADDVVPTLPKYSSFLKKLLKIEYVHLGQHYGVGNKDEDGILKEHKLKHYISKLESIVEEV